MNKDVKAYHDLQSPEDKKICNLLYKEISRGLPEAENKIWYAHPVWFLDGNPIVGYAKLKNCIRMLFWSGQSFEVEGLQASDDLVQVHPGQALLAVPVQDPKRQLLMEPQQVVYPVVVVDAFEPVALDARLAQQPPRVCASQRGILIERFVFHG